MHRLNNDVILKRILALATLLEMVPMEHRNLFRIGLLLFVPILLGGLFAWFAPVGSGESRESPNGAYTANVFNMSAGTFLGRREHYIKIQIVENSTGQEIWRVIYSHPFDAPVPDYSLRGLKFIEWDDYSSSIKVQIAGSRQMVLKVPF